MRSFAGQNECIANCNPLTSLPNAGRLVVAKFPTWLKAGLLSCPISCSQLALAYGARVSGSYGTSSAQSVQEAGVNPVFTYEDGTAMAANGPYDAVFDTLGTLPVTAGLCMRVSQHTAQAFLRPESGSAEEPQKVTILR